MTKINMKFLAYDSCDREIRSHVFLPLLNYELKTEHEKYVIQIPK